MPVLRYSQFAHPVSIDTNNTAVFNSLTLGLVVVPNEILNHIPVSHTAVYGADTILPLTQTETGRELLSCLQQQKVLLPIQQQTDTEDYVTINRALSEPVFGLIYLILSEACNLRCKYCFVEDALTVKRPQRLMTPELAQQALDLFASTLQRAHPADEPQVILYGGESFLNQPALRAALAHVTRLRNENQLPKRTSVTINTNGTLITDDVIPVLTEQEHLTVAISIDGPKKFHDAARPYHSGSGSFDDVYAGYRRLKDAGIAVGICCTVSRYNVDHLPEISEWLISELGVKSLGFNMMIEHPSPKNPTDGYQLHAEKTAEMLIRCFEIFREHGVYEDRFMRKVTSFAEGSVYFYDCGGCGQQMVVSPQGQVGTCQGNLGSGYHFIPMTPDLDILNHPYWLEWRHRSPLNMAQCRDCIALSLCGGGCPHNARIRHESIWAVDDSFCIHAKGAINYLIRSVSTSH